METTTLHIVLTALISLFVGAAFFIPLGMYLGREKKSDQDDSMPIPPSLRVPSAPTLPTVQAAPVLEQDQEDDDDDEEDEDEDDDDPPSPFETRLVAEGYECRFLEEFEFCSATAGQFNFAESCDSATCKICGSDCYPMSVWKNSGTHNETLVGYFCDCCGSGFTINYSLKDGAVTRQAATVGSLLSNSSPTVVSLPAPTDTEN